MAKPFTFINYSTADFLQKQFERYLEDPLSVDKTLGYFFEGVEFGKKGDGSEKGDIDQDDPHLKILQIVRGYRHFGHLKAKFNPLDREEHKKVAALEVDPKDLERVFPTLGLLSEERAPLKAIIARLETLYCSSIGYEVDLEEFPHVSDWIFDKIEHAKRGEFTLQKKKEILREIIKAEELEHYLTKTYPYVTRFSIEGGESFIPMMQALIGKGEEIEQFIFGMAHRGRLNFLVNVLGKELPELFFEFDKGYLPPLDICYDLKYHTGLKKGKGYLLPNPSHLESINPFVEGLTRRLIMEGGDKKKVAAVLIHGDAAIAGQGVVYETVQMSRLKGYETGGTLHIVINNQIGYTASPKESRSTRYATDIAKMFSYPVIHVNSEDVESVLFAAELSMEIRQKFGIDVFIDYNCYRRIGHNEGDEVSYTNPVDYKYIKERPLISDIYKKGVMSDEEVKNFREEAEKSYDQEKEKVENLKARKSESPLDFRPFDAVTSKITESQFFTLFTKLRTMKEGFEMNPKLKRILEQQEEILKKDPTEKLISWGLAENLAFGALLDEKISIRLSGQDCIRGTFSSRHAGYYDMITQELFIPLATLHEGQGRFDVLNSLLSEFAGLGFEVGYSLDYEEGLVIWEAQYGDFFNGAQIVIDQYLSALYDKWGLRSHIMLLLPHAMEGSGSEHSSARLERFLQLSAKNNWFIVYPSTAAQYFHMIRRQGLKKPGIPLIALTPKGSLRYAPSFASKIELLEGTFQEIIDDETEPREAKKVILCTGHVFHDLVTARKKENKEKEIALIRIEQLYPLNKPKIQEILQKYPKKQVLAFVQEEHENQGALEYILSSFRGEENIKGISRPPSPVTAAGYSKLHERELKTLMDEAMQI